MTKTTKGGKARGQQGRHARGAVTSQETAARRNAKRRVPLTIVDLPAKAARAEQEKPVKGGGTLGGYVADDAW